MNKIVKLLFFFSLMLSGILHAQLNKGDLVDGVAAVIGDQVILESDVDEQMNYAKQMGGASDNRCEFMESLMNNKVMVYKGKTDTLIVLPTARLKAASEQKFAQIKASFATEKEMLEKYKYRTSYEMLNAIEKIDAEQYYFQQKLASVTSGLDVTPSEVNSFYNEYKSQLPDVPEEVMLSQISIKPELSAAHKQQLIDKLTKIREDILKGADFTTQVQLYSDDKASVPMGGLYKNTAKGSMVKNFEGTALSLAEGEISEPVETEFGFHIIQLMKKSGNKYDARHILLEAKPNQEEILAARKKMDSISNLIKTGKMTFKEAAVKFSDDKNTKFTGGIISDQNGNDKLGRYDLPAQLGYQITGLSEGDITEPFTVTEGRGEMISIVQLRKQIPAHKMNLEEDYDRIKNMILERKKAEKAESFIRESIPSMFISISDQYKDCTFKNNWKR